MDAEILHSRLAAAEGAVIRIDGRLDGFSSGQAAIIAQGDRLTSLEEKLTACLENQQQLLTQQTALTTATTALVEAETREAEAEAEEAEAQAEISEAIADSFQEPEVVTEADESQATEEAVTELDQENPSEGGDAQKEASLKWWERLLTVR